MKKVIFGKIAALTVVLGLIIFVMCSLAASEPVGLINKTPSLISPGIKQPVKLIIPPQEEEQHVEIEDLKGPNWEKYLGEVVTIEGIFVQDPLPILVTDLDVVRKNEVMPDDSYIILTGYSPEMKDLKPLDPDEYGGALLELKGVVKSVDDPKNKDEHVGLEVISYSLLEWKEKYNPKLTAKLVMGKLPERPVSQRYAILFSGGANNYNNHIRYWNDLKFMYYTLINRCGFPNENIRVLYADGDGRDTDMPVHYSATQANLQTVFNELRDVTTSNDCIFLFTTNHGGGFKRSDREDPVHGGRFDADGDEIEGRILEETWHNIDLNSDGDKLDEVSWDEDLCAWGEYIYDDAFYDILADLEYNRLIIVMEQCYSGGLIADMAQGGSNRIIISAAGEYESSYAMPPSYNYDEFSYYFTCALNHADPDGRRVDADTDDDGKVSILEAFNYAQSHDTRPETPWYEDDGNRVPHSGSMPSIGDGNLGDNTSLDWG